MRSPSRRFIVRVFLMCILSVVALRTVYTMWQLLIEDIVKTETTYSYVWPIRRQLTEDGLEELILEYKQTKQSNIFHELTVPDTLVKLSGARGDSLTFDDLVKLPDSQWKLPVPREAYLVHKPPLDLVETVANLMSGKPIVMDPAFKEPLRFHHVSKTVCIHNRNSRYKVIFVVKISVAKFELRKQLRNVFRRFYDSTVKDMMIGLVFTIGRPPSQGNNYDRDALPNIGKTIAHEINEYDDLIVGDYEDTYRNLTIKMIHTLNWAATYCRHTRPTLVFMDDDVDFNLNHLKKIFLAKSPRERDSLLHGIIWHNAPVWRINSSSIPKFQLQKDEFPFPTYAPYANGPFVIVGFDKVERLALGMLYTQHFPMEDAYMGVVSLRLGLDYNRIQDILPTNLSLKRVVCERKSQSCPRYNNCYPCVK